MAKYKKEKSFTSKLPLKALISFSLKGGGALLGLLIQLILARTMSPESFGIFTIGLTFAVTAVSFASFGIPFSAIKYIPQYIENNSLPLARGFFRISNIISRSGSITFMMLSLTILYLTRNNYSNEMYQCLLLAALTILPLTATQTRVAHLQSLEAIPSAEFVANIIRPTLTIFGVVLIFLLYPNITLSAQPVMLLTALSAIIAYILGGILFKRAAPPSLEMSGFEYRANDWIKSGGAMLLIMSGVVLNERMDVLLVGGMLGPEEAGVYGICGRLSFIIGFAVAAVNSLLGPRLAGIHAEGDRTKTKNTAVFGAWLAFTAALMLAIVLGIFSDKILTVFGSHFRSGLPSLLILMSCQVIMGAFGSTGAIAILQGGYRVVITSVIFGLALNLILNILLIPQYGLVGAAIATFSAMTMSHIFITIWLLTTKKINPTITGQLPWRLNI